MNGFIRLGVQVESRSMTSPLESVTGLLEGKPALSGLSGAFSEVFAAVDSESIGEHEALPPETSESESVSPEQMKPDLIIPMVSPANPEEPEILLEPRTVNGAVIGVMPLEKVVDENPPAENETGQVETAQDKPIGRDSHASLLQVGKPKDALIAFNPPPPSHQRGRLALSADNGPVKGSAAPFADNFIPKEAQPSPETGLAKSVEAQQEPKSGPAQDGAISRSRSGPSNPLQAAAPLAAAPFPALSVPMPAMTITDAVVPHIAAAVPTTTPVLPVLDMQAGNQWIARLSQDIDQLSTEKPVLNFQLKPEHLGKLTVRITADVAGDVVRLETENENIKALLIGSQGRLEQDIRLSGLKLARVDVTVQDHSGSQLGQHGSGSREGGSETGRNGGRPPRTSLAERSMFAQNEVPAAQPDHGARYA